jgi:hypothetical protein
LIDCRDRIVSFEIHCREVLKGERVEEEEMLEEKRVE